MVFDKKKPKIVYPPSKCIEPPNPPHIRCSLSFIKPGLDLLFENFNFHRPEPIVDSF
jgi:hypothetical protein